MQTSLGGLALGRSPRPDSRTAFPNEPTLAACGLAGVGGGLAVLDWPAGRPFKMVANSASPLESAIVAWVFDDVLKHLSPHGAATPEVEFRVRLQQAKSESTKTHTSHAIFCHTNF